MDLLATQPDPVNVPQPPAQPATPTTSQLPVDQTSAQASVPVVTPPTTTPTAPNPVVTDDAEADEILHQDILSLMGIKDMSDEERAALYQTMLETIQTRVISSIADELSPEDQKTFQDLANGGDKNGLDTFLTSHNIDLSKRMLQEAMFYKAEMATLAQPIVAATAQQDNPQQS